MDGQNLHEYAKRILLGKGIKYLYQRSASVNDEIFFCYKQFMTQIIIQTDTDVFYQTINNTIYY